MNIKYDNPIPIEEITSAKERLKGEIVRTPLVRFNYYENSAEIYIKLENLHPIKSFKIRAACNAVKLLLKVQLKNGVDYKYWKLGTRFSLVCSKTWD